MKLVCLLFLLSFSLAKGQDKRLYELPMGKHAIGFKTIQVLDLSRIRHYNQALSLIQGDQDPDLTVSLRERIHAGSLENLKKLQEM